MNCENQVATWIHHQLRRRGLDDSPPSNHVLMEHDIM